LKARLAKKDFHPIIYTYLKKFQDDPTSRVFAPLAEAYRKSGLIDEALEIAREGMRVHPNFVGGRVALARALLDKKLFTEVVDDLVPVVRDNPDNLVAQRLVAESCLILGRLADALSAYKMLLFFTPYDREVAQMVQELEAQAYEKGVLILRTDPEPDPSEQYQIQQANGAIDEDPGIKRQAWVRKIERLQGLLQKVERYRARG
jgi:tetratricopeptide (TPR) repeat protein